MPTGRPRMEARVWRISTSLPAGTLSGPAHSPAFIRSCDSSSRFARSPAWATFSLMRVRSTISTRLPTPAEADLLARPVTQPVLVVQYVNADLDGKPVEAATTLFAADAVQLTVESDGEVS